MNANFEPIEQGHPPVAVGLVGGGSAVELARAVADVSGRGMLVVDDSHLKPFRPGMVGLAILAAMGLAQPSVRRELGQHDLDCLRRAQIKRESKAMRRSLHQ